MIIHWARLIPLAELLGGAALLIAATWVFVQLAEWMEEQSSVVQSRVAITLVITFILVLVGAVLVAPAP